MKPSLVIPLLACLLLATGQADERRLSGEDTARHPTSRALPSMPAPAPSMPSPAPSLRFQSPSSPAHDRTLLEDIDPAVRQYWSDKCVQQRARGWGYTGDCNHPAYSGGYYGPAPMVVPDGYRSYGERAGTHAHRKGESCRRRGHLGILPPRPQLRGYFR